MSLIILVYSNKILSGLSQTMQVWKIRSDNSCRSVCDIPIENGPYLLGIVSIYLKAQAILCIRTVSLAHSLFTCTKYMNKI